MIAEIRKAVNPNTGEIRSAIVIMPTRPLRELFEPLSRGKKGARRRRR